MPTESEVISVLGTILDPELGIDLWTLGLIYDVEVEGHEVYIEMTLTSPFCPMGPEIIDQVRHRVSMLDAVESVDVNVVFDPPWTPPEDLRDLF